MQIIKHPVSFYLTLICGGLTCTLVVAWNLIHIMLLALALVSLALTRNIALAEGRHSARKQKEV
jgi:hypothetical protein